MAVQPTREDKFFDPDPDGAPRYGFVTLHQPAIDHLLRAD